MAWPLREALLRYREGAVRNDLERWRFEILSWQIGGGTKPRMPRSLRS